MSFCNICGYLYDITTESRNATAQTVNKINAYFFCRNCSITVPIKPKTVIYVKHFSGENVEDNPDYSLMTNDPTYPRTKNYICPNKVCSANKAGDKREAIITKNNVGQAVYVCTLCKFNWIESNV